MRGLLGAARHLLDVQSSLCTSLAAASALLSPRCFASSALQHISVERAHQEPEQPCTAADHPTATVRGFVKEAKQQGADSSQRLRGPPQPCSDEAKAAVNDPMSDSGTSAATVPTTLQQHLQQLQQHKQTSMLRQTQRIRLQQCVADLMQQQLEIRQQCQQRLDISSSWAFRPAAVVQSWRSIRDARQSGRESKFAQQRDIPRSPLPEKKNEPRHNQQIRAPEIMVIFPDGSKQILDNASAKAAAASLKLDLVEVSARVNPPVARIMDYGQHRYEQQKKADEAEKQKRLAAKFNTPKEMQFSTRIGDHDLEFKLKKVLEFLEDGYRVQLTVKHKREEEAAAAEALDYLVARIQSSVAVEAAAKQQRRRALTILVKPKGTPEQTAAS